MRIGRTWSRIVLGLTIDPVAVKTRKGMHRDAESLSILPEAAP